MLLRRRTAIGTAALLTGCLSSSPPTADEDSSSGDETSSTAYDQTSATTSPPATTGPQGMCEDTPLRVATYNINEVGFLESDQFAGLAATLFRIDADVVCMQEVHFAESGRLDALAEELGYSHVFQAEMSPAIGGDWTNACIGRVPLELVQSYTARELGSDPNANDLGRDILVVRAEPEPGCFVGMFTIHLKAGAETADIFRKTVETERLVQAIEKYRSTRPEDAVIVLGDFNEQVTDDRLGDQITSIPDGLPDSYRLGADIDLPLVYHPFERLEAEGFTRVDATWEDSSFTATWNEASRLDYVFFGQARFEGSEVYNSCEDNGVDDDPPGGWLPKRGEPVPCGASEATSDHLPLVVDLTLP